VLAALAALLVAALSATGCVSVPTGGPVISYPVTQGTAAQNQPYVQIQPQPPGAGWSPADIVRGFLTASASYGNDPQVVKEYLTPEEQNSWNPSWSAVVYKNGPTPTAPIYPSGAKHPKTASVGIAGAIQASLLGNGNYSVPSASAPGGSPDEPSFELANVGGQWRISSAPQELLLTSNSFANDYQLRKLYFFDPLTRFLVPDPVYVPVRAKPGDLMEGLVSELIAPPGDWLSGGATRTAFPQKTKVSNVALNGVTAVVYLTGTAIGKAGNTVMAQLSAQLLSTLSGAAPSGSTGQGVQSVEVVVNGKTWTPLDGQDNPVQPTSLWHQWSPPSGASNQYYYIAGDGYLTSRTTTGQGKPVSLAKIGTGYSQIAVSADGTYLAALRGGVLYTGLVDGPLTKRGTGFASLSWDNGDDLWTSQNGQVVMFRSTQNERQPQPLTQMVSVDVFEAGVPVTVPFTALQVAPDGVRVAIVMGGNELTFGAISRQQTQSPRISLSLVQETVPVGTNFTALTWYGPDDVITLAGSAVTDYAVSGGSSTSIQAYPGMQTITASYKQPLIAGLSRGGMAADASLTGSWMTIKDGDTPASGTSPVYPG
jgi:hypothetical protein